MSEHLDKIIVKTGSGVYIPILGAIMPSIETLSTIFSFIGVLVGISVGLTALYLNIKKIKKG